MKKCEVCGTLNLKKNNYCTHCGCRIVEENICPVCGQKNPDSSDVCINCHAQITPIAIDSFDVLFSEHNLSRILNANFQYEEYVEILKNIFKKLDYANISGESPKEKVFQIANVFTYVVPKSSGIQRGEYGSQLILFDDRLDESLQTSTIIHELAHFLLFDITVNILSKILEVNPSPVIKSFVEHFLTLPDIEVINEFYAHSVENRFIPLKYQNFNSFIKCVTDLNMGSEEIDVYIRIANSFAYEVIHYLQKYIDDDLREAIRLQFKIDMIETKKLETDFGDLVCDPQEKNIVFLNLIGSHFEYLLNNEEAREELGYLKNRFEDFD